MRTARIFEPAEADLDAMIAANPLAQIVSVVGDGLVATPLPLLLERPAEGPATLLGRFARANPHLEAVEHNPEALAIFMGPHGYVSPSWLADRTQAPTWNFATAHLRVMIWTDRSEAAAREAVDRLTEAMERGRPRAWTGSEMGARYGQLVRHVVAFRAEVLSVTAKFKLGQNERPDVLADALAGLAEDGGGDLASAMRHANRLDAAHG